MKKLIVIILIASTISSCGIRFGDYHEYQRVHEKKC